MHMSYLMRCCFFLHALHPLAGWGLGEKRSFVQADAPSGPGTITHCLRRRRCQDSSWMPSWTCWRSGTMRSVPRSGRSPLCFVAPLNSFFPSLAHSVHEPSGAQMSSDLFTRCVVMTPHWYLLSKRQCSSEMMPRNDSSYMVESHLAPRACKRLKNSGFP